MMSVYLPNITKTLGGPTGWQTPFIVQNVGATTTTIEVSFYAFLSGALVACRRISDLAPATSFADVPNNDVDLPDNGQFAVVVRSFGSQIVAVVNEHQGVANRAEALSYVGLAAGTTRVGLPYVAKTAAGWLTTFIMQNLGAGPARVDALFANADGSRVATLSRTILPGRSQFINPLVEPALSDGTEYAVTLTSDQPIAVIANAHRDDASTPAPMAFSYNGVTATGLTPTYLPYVARNTDGINRQTRVVVENTGVGDATPTLTLQRIGGGSQVTITAPTPIKAGRSWSFDPRFMTDGTTPCPPQGGPTCVAEGEHSLTVSGGSFAVLAAITSPASAMGYTGTLGSPSRVYLPNITRTLGGSAGWSTPIIVQSLGATAATLHWYRFADGALVQTQQLTGLVAGQSVRVDPRSVPGLSDDTQYAVVLDARGPVTAMVTELSLLGGDGAMAYEGFASDQLATPIPMTIALTPAAATIGPGQNQQFNATVLDQFGTASGAAISWTVAPPGLGTVSGTGLFTAGPAGGTGTVVAGAGALTASARISIQLPTTTTIGGISFHIRSTASADFYAEAAISDADTQTLASLVDPAVAYVQADFGRTYTTRPQIYAFASAASVAAGWNAVLGATSPLQSGWAGIFIFESGRIGLSWPVMKTALPYETVRHELTHKMEHQITHDRPFPSWFDEGMARFEDLSVPGGQYRIVDSRVTVVSMSATGTLLNVNTGSDAQFYSWPGEKESYAYYEAAETVRLMRTDLTQAGIVRMLEAIGAGQSFDAAYASVSGQPLSTFNATRNARLLASAPTPGIGTAPDTFLGPGLSIEVYGLAPFASVTIWVSSQSTGSSSAIGTASDIGVYKTYLGSTWPRDTYTITVTSGPTTLTTAAAKTTSISADALLFLDPLDQDLLRVPESSGRAEPEVVPIPHVRPYSPWLRSRHSR